MRAVEYFAQVAFDREEFMSFEKVSHCSSEAFFPSAEFAFSSSCIENLVVEAYLSSREPAAEKMGMGKEN